MKTRNLTTKPTYHSYPVLTDAKRGLAIDTDIMSNIEAQFNYAEDTKSKVFFYRLDLRYPDGASVPNDNNHFKHFASAYKKNLSRQGLRPQYFAVREQSRKDQGRCHYHMGVILDGQKTRNCYGHLDTAERLWAHELGLPPKEGGYGLVHHCDKDKDGERMVNGVMLDPNDYNYEDKKDTCVRRSSYLAKENTKGSPKGVREYFASQLPKEYRPVKPKKSKSNDDGD